MHIEPLAVPYCAQPDLSLPLTNEKSTLPAIIVTPSTPTTECAHQFYIAFSPKPTFRERVLMYLTTIQPKARTIIILSLLLFVVMCHLFAHQFALRRPHLRFDDFEAGQYGDHLDTSYWGWFGVKSLWNVSAIDNRRSFMNEPPST